MRPVLIPALLVVLFSGCTHMSLQRNTVHQADTLGDVYQQQVLDNLAEFAENPAALPHFAFPSAGTDQVTDGVGATDAITWVTHGFNMNQLTVGPASRAIQETWTMTPINDPRALDQMRAVYQKAVADRSWFQCGSRKDVPRDCSCLRVGHYCGTYVWVPPEGRERLTQLTLAILDIAVFEPGTQVVATKSLQIYVDSKGAPTTQALSVAQVTVTVPANAPVTDIGAIVQGHGVAATGPVRLRAETGGNLLLQLKQQLQTVTPLTRP